MWIRFLLISFYCLKFIGRTSANTAQKAKGQAIVASFVPGTLGDFLLGDFKNGVKQ